MPMGILVVTKFVCMHVFSYSGLFCKKRPCGQCPLWPCDLRFLPLLCYSAYRIMGFVALVFHARLLIIIE